jgi:hypothetical protein
MNQSQDQSIKCSKSRWRHKHESYYSFYVLVYDDEKTAQGPGRIWTRESAPELDVTNGGEDGQSQCNVHHFITNQCRILDTKDQAAN